LNALLPITARRQGAVATLTIDRPDVGNALRGEDLGALAGALRESQRDLAVRVIVLTGAGGKFFCSGSDIAELAGGLPDIGIHLRKWHDVVNLLESSEKPVIAAINGAAVGDGLELALACQRRIAVDSARLGLPELKVGLFPAAGAARLSEFEPNAVRAALVCARAAALGTDSDELEISLLRECYVTPRNRQVLESFLARPRAARPLV
jgi:enoyl-CoA hydratase/carnithine racemase